MIRRQVWFTRGCETPILRRRFRPLFSSAEMNGRPPPMNRAPARLGRAPNRIARCAYRATERTSLTVPFLSVLGSILAVWPL